MRLISLIVVGMCILLSVSFVTAESRIYPNDESYPYVQLGTGDGSEISVKSSNLEIDSNIDMLNYSIINANWVNLTHSNVSGNVTAQYFIGDGSQLTGIAGGVNGTDINPRQINLSDGNRILLGDDNNLEIDWDGDRAYIKGSSTSGDPLVQFEATNNVYYGAIANFYRPTMSSDYEAYLRLGKDKSDYDSGTWRFKHVSSGSADNYMTMQMQGTSNNFRINGDGTFNFTGNVTAPYYFGDGSQLTGISTSVNGTDINPNYVNVTTNLDVGGTSKFNDVMQVESTSPPFEAIRNTAITAAHRTSATFVHKTSGNMADNFGSTMSFRIEDNSGVTSNYIGDIYATRDGADNTGRIWISPRLAGSAVNSLLIETDSMKFLQDNPSYIGAGNDAYTQYNGTDYLINPKSVGSGRAVIKGTLEIDEDVKVGDDLFVTDSVGIGGADASVPLDVNGRAIFTTPLGTQGIKVDGGYVNYNGFKTDGTYNTYQQIGSTDLFGSLIADTTNVVFGGYNGGIEKLSFYSNSIKALHIDENGNVNTSNNLDVGGNITFGDTSFISSEIGDSRHIGLYPEKFVKIFQGQDTAGLRVYGYDDKITDYVDLSLNGNGVPILSATNNLFMSTGLQFADDTDMVFGNVAEQYSFGYDSTDNAFELTHTGGTVFSVDDTNKNVNITNDLNVGDDLEVADDAVIGNELSVTNGSFVVTKSENNVDANARKYFSMEMDGNTNDYLAIYNNGGTYGSFEPTIFGKVTTHNYGVSGIVMETTSAMDNTANPMFYIQGRKDTNQKVVNRNLFAVDNYADRMFRIEADGTTTLYNDLEGKGDNVNISDHLIVDGNFTGTQFYAELWNHSETGVTHTIIGADTYINITTGTRCDELNGFTCTGGILTASVDGLYDVDYGMSFNGGNGDEYHPSIGIDGEWQIKCHNIRDAGSASANGNVGGSCFLRFTAGDEITFMVENDNDADDITIGDFSVNIIRIGD